MPKPPPPEQHEYRERVVPLPTLGIALVLTVLISMTLTLAVDRGVLGGSIGPRGPQGPPGSAAEASATEIPTEPVLDALESDPERVAGILAEELDARDEQLGRRVAELKEELVALCDTLAASAPLAAEGIQCP